eukprot:5432421-Ditylum_brightwellii.AAC.1
MFKLVSDVLPNFWYEDEDDDKDNDDYQVPLVCFYPKTSNHSNDFLFVHNCGPLLEETISSVDFGQIRDVLHSKKRGSGTKRNENQPSCSYGYATMSYKVGPSGYNIPTLLTDTNSEFTKSLFLVGTSIIRLSLIPQQFRYVSDLARQKLYTFVSKRHSKHCSTVVPHKDPCIQLEKITVLTEGVLFFAAKNADGREQNESSFGLQKTIGNKHKRTT